MAFNPYYNPYQNPYQNNYMGYQQMPQQNYMASNQSNQIPQNNQMQPVQTGIPGQMVDSFEAAKAKDVDMTGTPRYYPNINGQEVYMKQLQADGTCPTIVYRRVEEVAPVPVPETDPKFDMVLTELEAIKAMLSEPKTKGGAKT